MRADDIRSTTFQSETSATSNEVRTKSCSDESSHRSQTRAIRLDGRKGEKTAISDLQSCVELALEDARDLWIASSDASELRLALLNLLARLEGAWCRACFDAHKSDD